MSYIARWMFTLTLAFCIFFAIFLFAGCQTVKSCTKECTTSVDNIEICEELCK